METRDHPLPSEYDAALMFVQEYALMHDTFDGGMPLEAWRRTGVKGANRYWRNNWTKVMNRAVKAGYVLIAGKAEPQAKQSHTRALNLYVSRLRRHGVPFDSAKNFLGEQVSLLRTGKINAHELAWRAYTFGCEQ